MCRIITRPSKKGEKVGQIVCRCGSKNFTIWHNAAKYPVSPRFTFDDSTVENEMVFHATCSDCRQTYEVFLVPYHIQEVNYSALIENDKGTDA